MPVEHDDLPDAELDESENPLNTITAGASALKLKATEITQAVPQEKVGFPIAVIISIITALLPEIIKCFIPENSAQAKQYIKNRYVPTIHNVAADPYRGYRPLTVKRIMSMAKRQAARGGRRLTDDGAREIAIAVLDDIRTGDSDKMEMVINEVL